MPGIVLHRSPNGADARRVRCNRGIRLFQTVLHRSPRGHQPWCVRIPCRSHGVLGWCTPWPSSCPYAETWASFSVTAHISVKHVQKASEISIVFAVIQEKLPNFNYFFDTLHTDSMDYRVMINLKGQFWSRDKKIQSQQLGDAPTTSVLFVFIGKEKTWIRKLSVCRTKRAA